MLLAPESRDIAERVIPMGHSLWYSPNSFGGKDPKGVVEYDMLTNSIKLTVPYPSHFKHGSVIYIVDGHTSECIYSLDTSSLDSLTFKKEIEIGWIGDYTSCITIGDCIHILNGGKNNGKHLVYNVKTKKLETLQDPVTQKEVFKAAFLGIPIPL